MNYRICSIAGCGRAHYSRGWCSLHYSRWRRHGDPAIRGAAGGRKPDKERSCGIDGCEVPVRANGLCVRHNQRLRVTGDALTPLKQTPHGSRLEFVRQVIADDPTECVMFPEPGGVGHVTRSACVVVDGVKTRAHVAVMLFSGRPRPAPEFEVCHSCGNGHLGCITPSHLRWGTRQDNVNDMLIHETRVRRFSPGEVRALRNRHAAGVTQAELARETGASQTAISNLVHQRTYKDVH